MPMTSQTVLSVVTDIGYPCSEQIAVRLKGVCGTERTVHQFGGHTEVQIRRSSRFTANVRTILPARARKVRTRERL